jgi:LacI family transcriptional regulator
MAVTRNDVARRAGVSPGLVSYVLNDGPRPVSDDARARIEAAIEELGYRRDGVARYLKTGKTNSLGLVLPDIGLPYYAEITKEMNARAFELGYQLLIATSEFDVAREDVQLESLAERRVDGIILMSVNPNRDFSVLERLGTPVVVIDRPEFAVESARAATSHLIEDGHRRIGFLGSGPLAVSERRLAGWSEALRDAGLARNDSWIITAPITRAGGYDAALRLLKPIERPSALLIESDAQASGFVRAAKDLGLDIPGDVAIITSEGTDLARFTVPSLTSIVPPTREIAMDAIRSALATDAEPVRRVNNVSFELALRESCGH